MRRFLLYCIVASICAVGMLIILWGIFLMPGSGNTRSRVVSTGCILVGLPLILFGQRLMPDWTPYWGRRLAVVYAWFWLVAGIVLFVLSWLLWID